MYDYFYGIQAEQFSFYRIPKLLFTHPAFKRMSTEAKTLYGILLDRMNLSAKNQWIDEEGRVYIIFTVDEIMEALGCAEQKAIKLLSELDTKTGLIERKRQGLGKPNLIYVKNFISGLPESQFKNCENHNSEAMKITIQELPKSQGNNTDISNTDMSDTDLFSSADGRSEEMRTRASYEKYFRDVLSSDSKALVEEHLETCEGCTDYYHALKEPEGNYKQMKKADEKAAFKKIKGTLKRKRLLTILVTAVCIAALGFGLFYGLVVHEKYIPYEESGLYVAEEAIRTDRNYYKSTGLYSPDGETLFLYMTTTAYTQMRNDTSMAGVPIISLDMAARTSTIEDDNGTVTEQVCKEVYYVPEKTAKQYMHAMKWTNEGATDEEVQKNRDKEVEELKSASVLVWSESE